MMENIRARVKAGMLELLEKVNLPEGTEVTITIHDKSHCLPDRDAFRRSAGGWKDTVDAEALIADIYASRLISSRPVPKL